MATRQIAMYTVRMNIRGSSLATTLIFTALALVVAVALAATSVTHLHFSFSQNHREKALAAAESVLALAAERLQSDADYGHKRHPEESLEIVLNGAQGYLTFHPEQASDWGLPYSTNNRKTKTPSEGHNGRQVPGESTHLWAVGRSGDITRRLEAVVKVPGFPMALASSGKIQSEGALLIGGLDNLEDAFPEINPDKLEEADMASNAAGDAITIEGEATVTGSVQAVGNISLGEDVLLRGELKPASEPVSILQIDLSDIRPERSLPHTHTPGESITGARHMSADRILRGGLNLEDGVLYVDGDLTVHGGVSGSGALLVDGNVTIHDGAALATDNQIALVAKGDVRVYGRGQNSSHFQGLIYTEGDLEAEDVTLLGSFVANSPASALEPGSRLKLKDAGVIYYEQFAKFESEAKIGYLKFEHREPGYTSPPVTIPMTAEEYEEWREVVATLGRSNGEMGHDSAPARAFLRDMEDKHGLVNPTRGREGEAGEEDGYYEQILNYSGIGTVPLQNSEGQQIQVVEMEPAFEFDLNEFLSESQRMKIVMWREG